METRFKRSKEYPNHSVSFDGDVFSHKLGRILKKNTDKDGYFRVSLNDNNEIKTVSVHKLVALTFIPNPDNLPMINHLDNDKQNNHYTNLEWCTNQQNINHYIKYFKNIDNANEKLLSDIEDILEKCLLGNNKSEDVIEDIVNVFKTSKRKKLSWYFKQTK